MREDIDADVTTAFFQALADLWTSEGRLTRGEPDTTRVVCSVAAAGSASSVDIARVAAEAEGTHQVQLHFVPGREWDGPSDIFVIRYQACRTRTIAGLRFWQDGENAGVSGLLSQSEGVLILFDGKHLHFMDVECSYDPTAEIERARTMLRAAAMGALKKE